MWVGRQDAVYFAYFAPYSFEAHQALVARTQCDPRVDLELLGETLDGHDIDLLKIGACPHTVLTACPCSTRRPGEHSLSRSLPDVRVCRRNLPNHAQESRGRGGVWDCR